MSNETQVQVKTGSDNIKTEILRDKFDIDLTTETHTYTYIKRKKSIFFQLFIL